MRSGSKSRYESSAASATRPPRAQAGTTAAAQGGNERIAALSALVEELTGQIDAIEGASRRDAIRRGVQQAAARPETPARAPAEPDPRIERIGAIEKRLAAIAERLQERDRLPDNEPAARHVPPPEPQRPPARDLSEAVSQQRSRPVERPTPARREARDEIGSLQAAIAEISARQQVIDRSGSRQLPTIDTLALEDALLALRTDIASLDRRITAEARRGEEFGRSLRSDFAGFSGQPGAGGSEAAISALRSDLAEIREVLDLAAREATLASIESGYGHVIERLDDIVRRVPERERLDALAREVARLVEGVQNVPRPREIDGELEDIRNAIASISVQRPDETLSQQIASLRHAVEALGSSLPASGDLARIEERLDALAGRFDGSGDRRLADLGLAIEKLAARPRDTVDLSRIEREIGAMRREIDGFAKGTDPVVLIRLEQQVAAIRTALDEKLPPKIDIDMGALSRLEQRLDALAGRLDALADLPSLIAPASDHAIAGLRSEISDLRSEVATRQPARLDEIEAQMSTLVARLDDATDREDGPALAVLEAQVGALAEKLASIGPGGEALAKVEANLDHLQTLLAEARRETIETARTTARSTVEEFAGSLAGGRDDDMVRALREDLRRLQEAALRSDQENQDTLESVHDTLAKVVDRIAQLEAEDAGVAVGFAPARNRGRLAGGRPAAPDMPEDHRPLAPGSGRPTLPAFVEPAADDAPGQTGDRKADFIAAARRAAQAAQAEAARVRAEDSKAAAEAAKPGAFARIGQALRGRRRPLVLAIAAVVLAIGAAKLGPSLSHRLADAVRPVAVKETTLGSDAGIDVASTGSIAPTAPRIAAANPPAAPEPAATPRLASPASPPSPAALVAPKANNDQIAFSPDPFTDFLAAPANVAKAAPPAAASVLDYGVVEKAAMGGDAAASFEMGRHLAEPVTGRADIRTAAQWYERSAKAGFALAQYRLGSLYERGEGVKLDVAAAQGWYEKAAAQGNARATHNLAVLISEGANGKPDYKRAAELFITAAGFGVADSQYNLGVLYARGLGVPVDLVQSYKWFALAAQQGDSEAGKRRDEVAKAMKDGDLATARLAVKAFEPAPQDAAANDEPAPNPAWFATARGATAAAGTQKTAGGGSTG